MTIDAIEARLKARLIEFTVMKSRVKFAFTDGGTLFIDATSSPPTLTRDDAEADVVVATSLDNMTKLLDGNLNPTLAFTLGKLKIKGSMGLAMKLAGLLEE